MKIPFSSFRNFALLTIASASTLGIALTANSNATPSFVKAKVKNGGGSIVTINDFKLPGTQPNTITDTIQTATNCSYCHGGFAPATEMYTPWTTSLMANSMRDPMFHAALAVAEQDAKFSGDLCLRCHSPGGWLEGHSTPTDGSAMQGKDIEGVTCHFCHRMVDPNFNPNASPAEDEEILNNLESAPVEGNSGNYVVDPLDRRRGPFDLGRDFFWHEWRQSPFHRKSEMCGTCHDVSNPVYTRVGGATPSANDTYVLNDKDTPHPTQLKKDQFPLERTFSEWSQSAFAAAPIDMNGRFGGNQQFVSTCQDCHMPRQSGNACAPGFSGQDRDDLPYHGFRGANSWVLNAVLILDQTLQLYGASEVSGLTQAAVDQAISENVDFLQRASDMELSKSGNQLNVRIYNQTGHKLPTGYSEGRRMWINVKFYNALGGLVGENGYYNYNRAQLRGDDTKVYEVLLGLDEAVAALTALPAGPSFHFALVNKVYKDNRIPPRGFVNANFEAVQAQPVGAAYADGQYWDDTQYTIPAGATSATATLYYQTTSREYVQFLNAENYTNNAGRAAWNLWQATGKSAPVMMDQMTINLP